MPTLPKYLEPGPWPVMSSGERSEMCIDDWGDAACPFCDHIVVPEGRDFEVGQKCRKCPAVIDGIRQQDEVL